MQTIETIEHKNIQKQRVKKNLAGPGIYFTIYTSIQSNFQSFPSDQN